MRSPIIRLFILLGLLFPATAATALDLTSYMPLNAGNQWSFLNTNYGTATMTVGSPIVLPGGITATPLTTVESTETGYLTEYYTNDSNGLRLYGSYSSSVYVAGYGNTSETISMSPAMIFAAANPSIGSSHTSSGTMSAIYANVGTVTLNYSSSTQVVGLETVTDYSNGRYGVGKSWPAIKVITSLTVSGTVNSQFISNTSAQSYWLVDGIGIVQYSIPNASGVMEIWKLTSTNVVPPKAGQTIGTISFSPTTLAVSGTTTASATATSGLAVSLSSTTPSVCSMSGSTVTGITAGTCTIAADQAGNTNYSAATQVTQSITIGGTPPAGTALNLATSWNLVGNSVNAPLTVATTFNDATKVSTVWKWIPATSKWAFYAPSLVGQALTDYAASKGYDVLTTINGGEGFWVNAKVAFTASLPTGTAVTTTSFQDTLSTPNPLPAGWSLISVGGNPTPATFNNGIGLAPPATGTITSNLTTLWAWNNAASNWYFYAPSLDANGTLTTYITGKSYLNFGTKTLDSAMGFWVNRPALAMPTVNAAEGFWIGTSSTGYNVGLAVLENGETWGLYSSGNTIYGALVGNTATLENRLNGTGTDYNILAQTSIQGSYSGTVTSKSSIAVTTSNGSSFNGTYRSHYDQSPSLVSLAGTYLGYGVSGTSTTQYTPVTVSSAGVVSAGSQALGCTASGSLTPRASGKNVYNLSITFTGANCALGNGITTTGIAILDTIVTPSRLYAMALKSDKSDGFIWTGTR